MTGNPAPPRRIRDLRAYVEALRAAGEVQDIAAAASLDLEIGAVIRRSYELRAPAPLFHSITGCAPGFRVLGAPAGVSRQPGLYLVRIALSLGLPAAATGQEIVAALVAAHGRPGVRPREVPAAPWQEHVATGDAVDLGRLPAPLLHGGDGGRYLNTYGCIVARTPDGSWTNWSIARIMVLDRNRMTGIVAPGQHLGMIHQMWKDRGEPMPFALALGVEPAIPFVCGMPLPARVDEADYLGAYFGEPVEVARCATQDLFAPASAEIVVEGTLSDTETAPEGPMGEYAGYNWLGVSTQKPVYRVTAVSHRADAILPVAVAGEPVEEDHTAWGIPNAAQVLHELRAAGLPVTMCWLPLEAANHWCVVTVPLDEWRGRTGLDTAGLCRRVGELLFASKAGSGVVKVLVFEDDIDPTDTAEVVWAYATRAHPGTSEHVFPKEPTGALAVYLDDGEKRTMTSAKAVYDCLTRDEWTRGRRPHRTSLARGYPADIRDRVLSRWAEYGYR